MWKDRAHESGMSGVNDGEWWIDKQCAQHGTTNNNVSNDNNNNTTTNNNNSTTQQQEESKNNESQQASQEQSHLNMHRGRKGNSFSFLNMPNIKDRVAQLFHGDDNHRSNKLCEWILLDNQSMVNIFCNEDLLGDIKNTNQTMTIDTNVKQLSSNNW